MDNDAHEGKDPISNEIFKHERIYTALQTFATNACNTKPGWSGKISDLISSSAHIGEISKTALISLIFNLNKSNLIPQFEFWYQEYDESLIIINKTNTGNWRALSNYLKEHQAYLKLFTCKLNRKLLSQWHKDKLTIEHLFFNNKPLGYPIQILSLDTSGLSCNRYLLKFRGGQTIIYMSRSFELEESFFNLSQLLGFYEISTPNIFTNSDYAWLKPMQIPESLNNEQYSIKNFYNGLIYSLIYTFDSNYDINQLIKYVKESPFYASINLLSFDTSAQPNTQFLSIDSQVELFIDGFTCGYRKVLSGKYTTNKLSNYSKLIPAQYLKKLSNQISETPGYPCVSLMNEEDLSNQIGLIRQEYCTSSD